MSAKQTGPGRAVKALRCSASLVAGVALALGLVSGCAGTSEWANPNKTAAETHADEQDCSNDAQENTMLRVGRTRTDYGMPPSGPTPGPQGTGPMQMKDRDMATNDFRKRVAMCMESKGYTRGKPPQG